MCEMACQIIQKKQEEKWIEEEQAAKAQNSKIPVCYDDDEDYSAITPNEPVDSLSMGDEHLDTILATESNEFIKFCVETLVPNPSEFEGENSCDVPACFTTFSNILFDAEYESDSSDYQSCSDEDFLKEIFSNPLFEEEIISIKIDQHHFNAESDLIESMLNHDSSIISSSSKIDSLLDEFAGELSLLKSILPGIDETDCYPEDEICFTERLLYDNSSPRPPEESVSENSDADIESFSPYPIPDEDSDSYMEEIDLPFNPDDPIPSSIVDDYYDSERDILIPEGNYSLSLPVNESFHFDILAFSRPPVKPPDGAGINMMSKSLFEHLELANPKKTIMVIETCDMTKKAPLGIVENILVIKGAGINMMSKSLFEHLELANPKKTSMVIETCDMTKKAPLGIVENILVKIEKFLFHFDFIVIDTLKGPNETILLGRPFLATIHAQIDVFRGEILLGVGNEKVKFDMNGQQCYSRVPFEKIYMASSIQGNEYFNPHEMENVIPMHWNKEPFITARRA
nr:hypothetical protein [Tanacetum cinerariifolium]